MKKPKPKTKGWTIETVRFYIDKTNYYEGKAKITEINEHGVSFTAIGKLVKKKIRKLVKKKKK